MVVTVTLGFMHFPIVGQRGNLKKRLIWLIFLFEKCFFFCVCVPKFVCY